MKIFKSHNADDVEIISKLDKQKSYVWISTWFGSGFLNPAPGTWGTLAAMPLGMLFLLFGNPYILILSIFMAVFLGFWSADEFEKATGVHDCKMVVIDEVAGIWIALLPISFMVSATDPYLILYSVLAFLFFRFFDITKIWPACYFDRNVKGAAGVMVDDLIAGVYSALILWGILYYAGSS
jgi:phosphatidylglycerophosphatase A